MALTANFLQDPIEVVPGSPITLTLRLHNDGHSARDVSLEPAGSLAAHLDLTRMSAAMETNQILDVVVGLDLPAMFEPGTHEIAVEISSLPSPSSSLPPPAGATARGETPNPGSTTDLRSVEPSTQRSTITATATANVTAHTRCAVELRPTRSRSGTTGKHRVRVVNAGNVEVVVDLVADEPDPAISIDIASPSLAVDPGSTGETTLRVTPKDTYWSGPNRTHDFLVRTLASDGTTRELEGVFEQRPRLPNWVGPAAAGALAALLIGAIAWFALLRPWVQDTADEAAATAIEEDRAALQLRIDELEAAAAEAEELPLGTPTDLRLSVAPTGGSSESDSQVVDLGEVFSVTDLVFQNPTGAVGTVSLLRDDDVLLQSELANFRDLDLHLVAPYVFEASEEITLEVDCRTPGTGGTDCPVSLSIVGFVDEAG